MKRTDALACKVGQLTFTKGTGLVGRIAAIKIEHTNLYFKIKPEPANPKLPQIWEAQHTMVEIVNNETPT